MLRYLKLRIAWNQIIKVRNIKGLHHQVAEVYELKNLSLWQRLIPLQFYLDTKFEFLLKNINNYIISATLQK